MQLLQDIKMPAKRWADYNISPSTRVATDNINDNGALRRYVHKINCMKKFINTPYNYIYSGMDLLTWPNVKLEQFHELIPELRHLEPSLRERIMIEGTLAGGRSF